MLDIDEVEKNYIKFKNMAEKARDTDEGHALACEEIASNYYTILKKYKRRLPNMNSNKLKIHFNLNSIETFDIEKYPCLNGKYEDAYIDFNVKFVLECQGETLIKEQSVVQNLLELDEFGMVLDETGIDMIMNTHIPFDLSLLSSLNLDYKLTINVLSWKYSEVSF